MARKIKIILFLILIVLVVLYLNNRIYSYDMRYYAGKDNGLFARFESIVVSSALFFLLLTKMNRILDLFIGFVIGIISGILGYFLTLIFSNETVNDIFYHVFGTILFMMAFFLIEKYSNSKKTNST